MCLVWNLKKSYFYFNFSQMEILISLGTVVVLIYKVTIVYPQYNSIQLLPP